MNSTTTICLGDRLRPRSGYRDGPPTPMRPQRRVMRPFPYVDSSTGPCARTILSPSPFVSYISAGLPHERHRGRVVAPQVVPHPLVITRSVSSISTAIWTSWSGGSAIERPPTARFLLVPLLLRPTILGRILFILESRIILQFVPRTHGLALHHLASAEIPDTAYRHLADGVRN